MRRSLACVVFIACLGGSPARAAATQPTLLEDASRHPSMYLRSSGSDGWRVWDRFVPTDDSTHSQEPAPRVTRATLAEAAAQAPEPGAVREVTIRWTAYAGATKTLVPSAQAVGVNRLEVLAERVVSGSLPHDRQPDFSGDQVLVVATDGTGATLSWQLLPDPRIVRAEEVGSDGILHGTVLLRTDPIFTFSFPDGVQPAAISIFKPRANDGDWEFDLIASIPMAGRK
jgi:hypothetical protein